MGVEGTSWFREALRCLCVTKPSNRKLPFISEMLLLNVFFLWVLMSVFIIGRECECYFFVVN